jgi:hypothetical protein
MKSLHTRLDEIKEEVLKAYQVGGYLECRDRGFYRDQLAFERWLREVAGDGYDKKASLSVYGDVQGLLDRALETFIKTVVNLRAQNEKYRQENEYLRAQLKVSDRYHADQLLELVKVCEK